MVKVLCSGIFIGVILLVPTLSSIEKSELRALDEKVIFAEEGHSVNILAKSSEGKMIQFCRWDSVKNSRVGNNGIVFVNDVDDIPSFSIMALQSSNKTNREVPGYEIFGAGLTKGECGITIQNVTLEDFTTWKYLLIEFSKAEGNPTAVTRDIRLEKAVRPTRPSIFQKDLLQNLKEEPLGPGDSFHNISCCSQNGVPHPSLQFVLENEIIQNVKETEWDPPQFCIHWKAPRFSRKDNGKKLKCTLSHFTTDALDESQKEDSVNLSITYKPELLTNLTYPQNNTIKVLLSKEENTLIIRYAANPQPTIQMFEEKQSIFSEINAEAKDIAIRSKYPEPCIWETRITFNKLFNETRIFKLVATNQVGMVQTFVLVIPVPEQIITTSRPDPDQQGLMSYWLLIPLILIVAIIVLAVIFLLVAKSRGWLCWKRQTGKYRTNEHPVYKPVVTTTD